MSNLFTPLSDEELDQLDDFLLDRFDEEFEYAENEDEERDEGILNISTLDGFLTAIVSGPSITPPSQWLPKIWGDCEPVWESPKEFEYILSLLMRHMNSIAVMLIECPDEFEPLFLERQVKGKTYLIVDDWCDGYLRAVHMNTDAWLDADEIGKHLDALTLFISEEGWARLDRMTDEEIASFQELITPAVRQIHQYWFERRSHGLTVTRVSAKVGRNESCPCGSGEKFKKCCGAGPTLH